MRKEIHPEIMETTVTCGCGETFVTRSTTSKIHVEVCSKCHPFYTGKQKFVDSAGRVERFKQKFKWTANSTKGGPDNPDENSANAQDAVAVEDKPETGSAD